MNVPEVLWDNQIKYSTPLYTQWHTHFKNNSYSPSIQFIWATHILFVKCGRLTIKALVFQLTTLKELRACGIFSWELCEKIHE
jgi:hypothetical protein